MALPLTYSVPYQILDIDGDSAKETVEYTALKGKKHKIWVIFEPSTVACYSAALVIQELCTGTRYRVSPGCVCKACYLTALVIQELCTGTRYRVSPGCVCKACYLTALEIQELCTGTRYRVSPGCVCVKPVT